MRLKEIEFAYDVSPVSKGGLTLVRPRTIDIADDGRFYISEYPELVRSTTYYSPGRNRTSIVTFHPESCRRADLPVPDIDGFQADMLKILPSKRLLLIQFGQWPEGKVNGLIITGGGIVVTELRLGECIADFAVHKDGTIYVIYNEEGYYGAMRKGQPLIECFSPEGEKLIPSEFLTKVLKILESEKVFDGNKIDLLANGGILVNGQYCFDSHGNLDFAWGHQSYSNVTIVDEYDNILFIPPVRGGIFQLFRAHGGFAEMAMSLCRPVDYPEYGSYHRIKNNMLYLLNRVIPKIEVFRLIYEDNETANRNENIDRRMMEERRKVEERRLEENRPYSERREAFERREAYEHKESPESREPSPDKSGTTEDNNGSSQKKIELLPVY